MRIISGAYKRRILKSPLTEEIRPTSDRAKETLFNILVNDFDFENLICLDLFCGSGNLGLECISRGAFLSFFVDRDTGLVEKNIRLLGVENKANIIRSDAIAFLDKPVNKHFDLIFCDPPYSYEFYDELIEKISLLKSILILEHSNKFIHSDHFEKFVYLKKKIGTVNFTFFDFGVKNN